MKADTLKQYSQTYFEKAETKQLSTGFGATPRLQTGSPGFESRKGGETFLLSETSRPALEPTEQ